jgi:hypothetical protein
MINRSICTSRKVNALKTDQARLLFTWLILHADDEGRMDGHPDTIKMTVVPGLNWTSQDIENYLQDLNQTSLIEYYSNSPSSTGGNCGSRNFYIQINKWHEFQSFHGIRLAPSKVPPPPVVQGDKQDNTNLLTPNTKQHQVGCLSKEKLREVKRSKDSTSLSISKTKMDPPNEFSDFKKLVFVKWNEVASKNGLVTVLKITKSREVKLKTRYDEGLFVQEVENIFREIEKSKLLLGKLEKPNPDHTNWKITFDWLIENDKNYLKVLEGNYRDKEGQVTPKLGDY